MTQNYKTNSERKLRAFSPSSVVRRSALPGMTRPAPPISPPLLSPTTYARVALILSSLRAKVFI
ncbi:hypothetical protein E2C01_088088 [Portunus trituberculatus]|uniref:Uncharacterized protein n=1 Tax=Portunus trituberculatus TaxID=210409 RepID=A0A5B7JF08_PORTR|nr:hypothetical protein [Portunus trituberculatus]